MVVVGYRVIHIERVDGNHYFGPHFLYPRFFWILILLDLNFLDPKIVGPNFFWTHKLNGHKTIWTTIWIDLKCFWTHIFLGELRESSCVALLSPACSCQFINWILVQRFIFFNCWLPSPTLSILFLKQRICWSRTNIVSAGPTGDQGYSGKVGNEGEDQPGDKGICTWGETGTAYQ